jgi:nickel-dependent lactate racemase
MTGEMSCDKNNPWGSESPVTDTVPLFQPTPPPSGEVDLDVAVREGLERIDRLQRLTVLVNDPQRDTSSRSVLELIVSEVEAAKIRILVATGTHNIPAAQRRKFEQELTAGLGVGGIAWHDSRSDKLVPIGAEGTWRGAPWLLEGGGLLGIGSVEPHYFAGFTGAHKTVTVGCAAYEDVEANHAAALSPEARPGRLEGNPVHEGIAEMLAALEAARSVAVVNLVQAGGRLVAAAGGRPLPALDALVKQAEAVFIHHIDSPADALIAEVTGPLARSFYQADKGIKNNEWAVRDGGVLVLVAGCEDGIGQDHFVKLLRQAPNYDEAVTVVNRRGYRLGDHKAVRLRYLTDTAHRGVKVFLVSEGLSDEEAGVLGLTRARSAAEALSVAGIHPDRHRVFRLLDAGNISLLPREI